MNIVEVRKVLQEQFKFARANVKGAKESGEASASHYWEGYLDGIVEVMAEDVKKGLFKKMQAVKLTKRARG